MKKARVNPRLWRWLGVNLCRLLLSVTFLFSGIVKLIDPRGVQYKIEDYAAWLDVTELLRGNVALVLSVALAMFEFYLGLNLFFGIRRRTTARLALLFMLVMTPLTFLLAVSDAHMDCGCFGEVIVLTNWQTFAKNVVLLMAAVVIVLPYRMMTRFITERNQWLLSLYSLFFAFILALYNIYYLPVMDFRPYHVGVDLPKAVMEEWTGDATTMRYADFSIQDMNGTDITFDWLEQPGYKFLLVSPVLEQADDGSMDKVNAIYDYCTEQGYPFLALTSSMEASVDRWKDLTGAEYDFAWADGTMLKTMIRSNPGLLLLHDGVIYQKWSCNDLPVVESLDLPLEHTKMGQGQEQSRLKTIYRLLLWFLVPLFVWTSIDRILVGLKIYERYKIHKTIEN